MPDFNSGGLRVNVKLRKQRPVNLLFKNDIAFHAPQMGPNCNGRMKLVETIRVYKGIIIKENSLTFLHFSQEHAVAGICLRERYPDWLRDEAVPTRRKQINSAIRIAQLLTKYCSMLRATNKAISINNFDLGTSRDKRLQLCVPTV